MTPEVNNITHNTSHKIYKSLTVDKRLCYTHQNQTPGDILFTCKRLGVQNHLQ